ncbi:MAG: tetratricopeptide repeat protein [Pseudomonadota bacterium]|nr:tetratricopeptide repeat protein [Pseudomonadota bacterium]MEE3100119.1 tetratricopeptide repeat protein [Pseudomonadota bacterium]
MAPSLDPTLDPKAERAARLDALFATLAAEDAPAADKAEAEIRRIWNRSGSDSMDLLLMRGRDALEKEDLTTALQHFGALTDHDPDFAEGWNMRATAFYLRGDLGMALADIERVLALEPRHFGALTGLAVILEQLGRDKDALTAWREAARINPHIEQAEEAIGRLGTEVDGRGI